MLAGPPHMAAEQGSGQPGPQQPPVEAESPRSQAEGPLATSRSSKKKKGLSGSRKGVSSSKEPPSAQGPKPTGSGKPGEGHPGSAGSAGAVPGPALRRRSRHRLDHCDIAAQRTYGPLLNRIFGKVRGTRDQGEVQVPGLRGSPP